MKPISVYRVYPDARKKRLRKYWYQVEWFRTVTELRTFYREVGGRGADTCGFCHVFKRPQANGQLGFIVLCKRWSGAGVTAHEACHSATRFMAFEQLGVMYDGLRCVQWNEERLCWLTGNITRGIVRGACRTGVYA